MARLVIIAVGRLKAGPEQEMVREYLKRATPLLRRLGLGDAQIKEIAESRAGSATQRRQQEARAILKALDERAVIVALDERGENLSSRAFAERLRRLAARAPAQLAIIIGGPDGLDEDIRRRADLLLSFGRLTWPHRLARVMLAEQLYRAGSIAAGLPYHRD